MNTELAEEIIADILMYPERLEMSLFFSESWGKTMGEMRDCGTTACIAGHVAMRTLPRGTCYDGCGWYDPRDGRDYGHIDQVAGDALGLRKDQWLVLFYNISNEGAVPALKYLIGNPDARGGEIEQFAREGGYLRSE